MGILRHKFIRNSLFSWFTNMALMCVFPMRMATSIHEILCKSHLTPTPDISLKLKLWSSNRSSRPEMFCKKGVLENFVKFRKTPEPESLFDKVADLRFTTLLKKRLWRRCLPVNF